MDPEETKAEWTTRTIQIIHNILSREDGTDEECEKALTKQLETKPD